MTKPLPSNPAHHANPIRGQREVNRRKMKAARPKMTPATGARLGKWRYAVEQARDNRKISLGCDRYLKRIAALPTVQLGGYADIRDDIMAGYLKRCRKTVMRYRAQAVAAGLIEDVGTAGLDNKPCMVRPILGVDNPVFTDISVPPSGTKVSHEPLEVLALERNPPTPFAQDNAPEKIIGRPLVAADVVSDAQPEPPPTPAGQGLGNDTVATAEPITFSAFWSATDRAGAESAAAAAWSRLSDADRSAIAAAIARQGRLHTGTSWVALWLKHRRWPTLANVPTTAAEVGKFRVEADSAAGAAWRRYWSANKQRGLPVGKDGYFVKRLPSLWPPEQ